MIPSDEIGRLIVNQCKDSPKMLLDREFPLDIYPPTDQVISHLKKWYGRKLYIIKSYISQHQEVGKSSINIANDNYYATRLVNELFFTMILAHIYGMLKKKEKVITVFCTSPLPCSGGHGLPSGPWPWAVINAALQYFTYNSNTGGSTHREIVYVLTPIKK